MQSELTRFAAPGSIYDAARADRAVRFINNLNHTKGDFYGTPFDLMPWQESFVRDTFGTIKPNGYRQFNKALLEISKKQGKSELGAAAALYLTCGDNEYSAEVYGCAADREQASIVFDVAVAMVDQCPALKSKIKLILSRKRMIYKPLNSFYQVLSAEAYTKHGLNVHGVIFDELHAQPNRELYDVMTMGSGDARKQPLFLFLTTAGNDINSIGYEVHQEALDIIEGKKVDKTFYPVIYSTPMDADWTDPEVWKAATPSLGVTVDFDKLENAFIAARDNPAKENAFRQLRLNQWVKQSVRWMQLEKWDLCNYEVDAERLKGRRCYAGLDLSSTTDISALVLVFPPEEDGEKYEILPFFWIPEESMRQRSRRDHVQYDVWTQQGYITATDGNVIHYGFIEETIKQLAEKYEIAELAYDRWGATHLVQNLADDGLTIVPFGQGFRDMSPATNDLMRLTLGTELAHGGNPVLRWMMDNVVITTDPAGNIKPDKKKSREKIDGVVALVMALDRALKNSSPASVYDSREMIIL